MRFLAGVEQHRRVAAAQVVNGNREAERRGLAVKFLGDVARPAQPGEIKILARWKS